MRFILIVIVTILPLTIFLSKVSAQNWLFPMDRYLERITLKDFGQLIDEQYYEGRDELFPYHRPTGYHAAVDLEAFEDETNKNVPVYAVDSGKISYIGSIEGYGGLILLKLDGENATALYGHVKIDGLDFKLGDQVIGGQILTYLGDAFTNETSKTRKHLHFGVYKGQHLYFRGYEKSSEEISQNWENPTSYLKNRGAISPTEDQMNFSKNQSDSTPINDQSLENHSGIFDSLINFFRNLIKLLSLNFNE